MALFSQLGLLDPLLNRLNRLASSAFLLSTVLAYCIDQLDHFQYAVVSHFFRLLLHQAYKRRLLSRALPVLKLLERLNLVGVIDELHDDLNQASYDFELKTRANLRQVQLGNALKKVCKASKCDELLLPLALLLVSL